MSLLKVFDVAGTGMNAQSVRMNTTASNLANAGNVHGDADEDGNVYVSNVNTVEEMVNMISASRSYKNNVEVVNTTKDLLLQTLSLGR